MALLITTRFRDGEGVHEFAVESLIIGRQLGTGVTGLELSADPCVSRQHASLECKEGACWIADLDSRYGTQVNGQEIRGQGGRCLTPEDVVLIGETTLRIAVVSDLVTRARADRPASPEGNTAPPAIKESPAPDIQIVQAIDTRREVTFKTTGSDVVAKKRLAILLDLPRQFAEQTALNDLLQTIMNRVVDVIPAARRGALLLRDAQRDALLLKAHVSGAEPAVSETLARRAMEEKRGFIWRSALGEDSSLSVKNLQMVSGMYAPLRWQDRIYGVICVDSPEMEDHFEEDDLQFLITLGQYAAMALADQEMRTELARNAKLVDRLMANFSPKVRALLVSQARQGKLRPGGSNSEVTLLFCDICGFTKKSSQMDPQDVVDMLNHYFQPFIEIIFRYDGTVDKFIGDAVLAVFGSPEPDPQQHQKAIRAAVAMLEAAQATSKLRAARGDTTFNVRIGIHCGEVFHGFVGAADRLEYTVIGDAVNRTCRYCDKAGESQILISQDVYQRVFSLVKAEKLSITTKEGELTAYRVSGLKS